jgi:hypothetical protein
MTNFKEAIIESEINSTNAPALARIFSSAVFNELAKKGTSPLLKSIFIDLNIDYKSYDKLSDLFELAYKYLQLLYRNEYLYKNIITNKILLGKHSLNTSTMLTEFRVSSSKADVMILNGTSHIYEIKTELDGLERLSKQLDDYSRFAEHVHVVTSERHLDKIMGNTEDHVGIVQLTTNNTLKTIRKSKTNIERISPTVIFESLRQNEYCEIIKGCGAEVPYLPNALLFRECQEIFKTLPKEKCHEMMVKTVKLRNSSSYLKEFITNVPKSLKAMAISTSLSKSRINNLSLALSRGII